MNLDREEFLEAAAACLDATQKAMTDILQFVRLVSDGSRLWAMATNSSVFMARFSGYEGQDSVDACVTARGLKTTLQAMRSGPVSLMYTDDTIQIEQGTTKVVLEARSSSDFPSFPSYAGIQPIYEGPNIWDNLKVVREIAQTHVGTSMLSNVVIFTKGASYLATGSSAARLQGTLVDRDSPFSPFAVPIESVEFLAHMKENIQVYTDKDKVVIVDVQGYVVIQKSAVELGNFPTTVAQTFSSLRQIGQVRLARDDLRRILTSADAVLREKTKQPVYVTLEAVGEKASLTGKVGKASFSSQCGAKISGAWRIPLNVERTLGFLRHSQDEFFLVKVMDSQSIPSPMCFVHLVDEDVHEVMGIPKDNPITPVTVSPSPVV